ncbi:hypothetical protein HYW75_07005 [Candidatus Pacearchaeota archaeon]|nr:hypothetical protein [Candidatus Pacearchaeota archaeon]
MENQITTIQIRENIKKALDRMKERSNESYEEVIINLLREKEKNKREQKELLIEGYEEMAKENLKITKEFEVLEDLDDWEW